MPAPAGAFAHRGSAQAQTALHRVEQGRLADTGRAHHGADPVTEHSADGVHTRAGGRACQQDRVPGRAVRLIEVLCLGGVTQVNLTDDDHGRYLGLLRDDEEAVQACQVRSRVAHRRDHQEQIKVGDQNVLERSAAGRRAGQLIAARQDLLDRPLRLGGATHQHAVADSQGIGGQALTAPEALEQRAEQPRLWGLDGVETAFGAHDKPLEELIAVIRDDGVAALPMPVDSPSPPAPTPAYPDDRGPGRRPQSSPGARPRA